MTRILIEGDIAEGATLRLEGEELHYLTRVRRCRVGDTVEVRCRSGRSFSCRVTDLSFDAARLCAEREIFAGLRVLPIRLLVSIPKRQLLDEVIRTASELGIERVTPVIAERTVVKPKGDKLQRWRRIADESLRQCGRERPLIVDDITAFSDAARDSIASATKLLWHLDADAPLVTDLAPLAPPIALAVGPEGGFAKSDIAAALSAGYRPVRLNTPILRIETASVAAAVLSVALIRKEIT